MGKFDLPEERLATTDEQGNRVYLFPADVRGWFKRLRNKIHFGLILVFLLLPWTTVNGYQTILLDIPNRRFALFGVTFWAHDVPMLFFVLATFVVSMLLLTALWGRIWCGWACPETVFVESVYRRLERWIEGDSVARRQLAAGPWTLGKVTKRSLKWLSFLVFSLILSHSVLAYFVGVERLAEMVQGDPRSNWGVFTAMAFFTGLYMVAFGWFREQFCIIVCPYGRGQAVLMDAHSMAVLYDEKRGEPRKGVSDQTQGDCINCYRCVQVCPTGVDIRRGVQLECVACTACIDACDEIMEKVDKPKGLIRYDTEEGMEGRQTQFLRGRTVAYLVVLSLLLSSFTYSLLTRKPVLATVLRAKESPYQVVDHQVINHFHAELSNHRFEDAQVKLTMDGMELVTQSNPVTIEGGKSRRMDFFVRFPKSILSLGKAQSRLKLVVSVEGEVVAQEQELKLLGPF